MVVKNINHLLLTIIYTEYIMAMKGVMNVSFELYFDSKPINENRMLVNCTIWEDKSQLVNLHAEMDVKKGETFLNHALTAMKFALEVAYEEDLDEFTIYTQHAQLLKWLVGGKYNPRYKNSLSQITNLLKKMVNEGNIIDYAKIDSRTNKAKKNLERHIRNNKKKYQTKEIQQLQGSFNDMFK